MTVSTMLLLVLAVAAVALVAAHDTQRANFHNGDSSWQESSSSRTSTSSTSDSDSSSSRIANAVEAALRELNADPAQAQAARVVPYEKFRLRLSTTNRDKTCAFFKCSEISTACPNTPAVMQNAIVTVETPFGNFNAIFDAAGNAAQLSDTFQFAVVYDGCRGFTLNTIAGLNGVNITSVTIATQNFRDGVNGQVYFDARGPQGSFDASTGENDIKNPTLRADNVGTKIGCDDTFDGFQNEGWSQFKVVAVGPNLPFLVTNSTVGGMAMDLSVSFSIDNVYNIRMEGQNALGENNIDQLRAIGLDRLPCAGRSRIIYDDIVTATLRQAPKEAPMSAELLEHPLLYDALLTGSATANPSFDNFVFQLKVAAGRTQVRLRDVVIDSGAFSILSHDSKFTPCFRVWPDEDFKIQTFIGMRNGGSQFVRATLQNGNPGPDLVQLKSTVNGVKVYGFLDIDNLPRASLPQFVVEEIHLGDLRQSAFAPVRPYESLRSDVDVYIEKCPSFSYFE